MTKEDYMKFSKERLAELLADWLERQGKQLLALYKIATILSQYEDKDGSPLEQIRAIMIDNCICACENFNKGYKAAMNKHDEQEFIWHREDEQNLNACLGYIPDEFLSRWLKDVIHAKYDKSADKVESKFHEGDWVVDSQGLTHQIKLVVENVTTHTFGYDIVGGGYFNDNTEGVRLWTIQDAKDGDVLVYEGEIFMIKSYALWNKIVYHCCYDGKNLHKHSIYDSWRKEDFDKVHPATKEQRDKLLKAITDSGYTFDFEKKELKKIEKNPIPMSLDEAIKHCKEKSCGNNTCALEHKQLEKWLIELKELKEQKPTWSEEDEYVYNKVLNWIVIVNPTSSIFEKLPKEQFIKRFKSVKERVQPQLKQNWSEEDEQYLLVCKNALVKYQTTDKWDAGIISHWLEDRFKSLRPQNTWKPSDEQMKAFEHFVRSWGESGTASPYDNNTKLIYSLLQDLKKLMEE